MALPDHRQYRSQTYRLIFCFCTNQNFKKAQFLHLHLSSISLWTKDEIFKECLISGVWGVLPHQIICIFQQCSLALKLTVCPPASPPPPPQLAGSGGEEESFVKWGFTPCIPFFKWGLGAFPPPPQKKKLISRMQEKPSNTFLPDNFSFFRLILYIFISH